MKRIITFLILFLPWFLSSLFIQDYSFYEELSKPFFAPPGIVFGIIWPILYFLIAISVLLVLEKNDIKYIRSYIKTLIWNYIFNQLFSIVFFGLENTFLGFADATATFLTSLFLYYETKELDPKASKFLIPYVLWNLFATLLSITIYFMNL